LKGGERIFKFYQSIPEVALEVVDMDHILFHIPNESSHTTTYNVSLSTHFCDCPSSVSSCKHILGVERIVREYFLPPPVIQSRVESFEATPMEDDVHNEGVISPTRVSPSDIEVNTISLGNNDLTKDLDNMLEEAQAKLQEVRCSIQNYSKEEVKYKMDVVRTFLTSLAKPFNFERPPTINLPLRGSIASIQANVKRIRMGHGKKNAAFEDEEESDPQPPSK
jgi:hypothetical protein